MKKFYRLFAISLVLCLASCATNRLHIGEDYRAWNADQLPTDKTIKHRVFLTGNTHGAQADDPVLVLLQRKLMEAGQNSSVVFLGDNVSGKGMPPREHKNRPTAEADLDVMLNLVKEYPGRVMFLRGEQDWAKYGLKGIDRQQDYVEEFLNADIDDKDDWADNYPPKTGCADPEVYEVNDQLVIVALDSQWYLEDWDDERGINEGCVIRDRRDFAFFFEDAIRKYRSRNIVVVMHHPLRSVGERGGYYTTKQHLFPLTELNDNLYVPLPVIGTVVAFVRAVTGGQQDLAHHRYQELIGDINGVARKVGNTIIVAAHDYNLQLHEDDGIYYAVSGSAVEARPTGITDETHYAQGVRGFTELTYYDDGSGWITFWGLDESGNEKVLYREAYQDGLSRASEDNTYPTMSTTASQVRTTVTLDNVKEVGNFRKFLLGEHHRDLYMAEYEFPVVDLDTLMGGMKVVKRGGGSQTNSLRLEDPDGRSYTMRSMTKDATRFLPPPFNQLVVAEIVVKDNFLSTHPFGALAVPPLADAIEVYHTNPKLYYVPKQPALGVHNDLYGDQVYLIEERPDEDWSNNPDFGSSKEIVGWDDMQEEIFEDQKWRIDQERLVRARLFDFILGDWDRHDDQWRWAEQKRDDGQNVYEPIPRDRDQVFAKYDGLITGIARLYNPWIRQLKPYSGDIKHAKHLAWSTRFFDHTYLNKMTREDWVRQARYIQERLTDDVIEAGLNEMPAFAVENTGDDIRKYMKMRRDNLVRIAEAHYEVIAERVDVIGTDKKESFLIERLDDQRTRVRMWDLDDGGVLDDLLYDRTFENDVTKEIDVYGQDGDDEFRVTGSVSSGPIVRLIGGLGEDTFVDESRVGGLGKRTRIYDNLRKNTVELGTEAKDKRSDRPELNTFNHRSPQHELDFTIPLPILGFNPDDGFLLGMALNSTRYGFQKLPYASNHYAEISYGFATRSPRALYQGEWLQRAGAWDLMLGAEYRGDRWSLNYFNLGNTEQPELAEVSDYDFYRVRQELQGFYPALRRQFGGSGAFIIQPRFERRAIEETPNRFITSDEAITPDGFFANNLHGGVELQLNYDKTDKSAIPEQGIRWFSHARYGRNFGDVDGSFTNIGTSLAFYQGIGKSRNPVVAMRVGGAYATGDLDVNFWQAASLGGIASGRGQNNLRGFRPGRFRGNASFFHQTDLRLLAFGSRNRVLPFAGGIFGSFDHGRVWLDGEDSDQWHIGYGGGIYLAPLNVFPITFGYFVSEEETRFIVQGGFAF